MPEDPPTAAPLGLHGPLGARLLRERARVREIAGRHGLAHPRVFGSVARSEETEASDVDVLVDVPPGVGLLGLARCQRELELLLGAPVDLVPASDLKPAVARTVLVEAVPL
jgi:predicted nucleotidyltransferase